MLFIGAAWYSGKETSSRLFSMTGLFSFIIANRNLFSLETEPNCGLCVKAMNCCASILVKSRAYLIISVLMSVVSKTVTFFETGSG